MSDYVKREIVEKILYDACHTDDGREVLDDVVELWHEVQKLPAAKVIGMKSGTWIKENQYTLKCSNCSQIFWDFRSLQAHAYNYCPCCGALMEGPG